MVYHHHYMTCTDGDKTLLLCGDFNAHVLDNADSDKIADHLNALAEENRRLRSALEKYAQRWVWHVENNDDYSSSDCCVFGRHGHGWVIAEEALQCQSQ